MMMRVIAEVVRTYVELRGAQAQLISARSDAEAQHAIARLVAERMRAGEASRFDLVRADAQARSTQSILPSLEADASTAAYRLVLLTGRPTETLQDELTEPRSEEHKSELQSLMRHSDAVFGLKKKKQNKAEHIQK